MAKVAKLKKREPSLHSRASRRQTTPPPANSTVKPGAEGTEQQPWLYHAQNAGISKKKKTKSLTRQQRLRQQRGVEHAARNVDKLEKKMADSKRRGKKVNERRAEWEELNGQVEKRELEREAKEEDQDVRKPPKENWMEKMVDVELKETMEEIEGFGLPANNAKVDEDAAVPPNPFHPPDQVGTKTIELDEVT